MIHIIFWVTLKIQCGFFLFPLTSVNITFLFGLAKNLTFQFDMLKICVCGENILYLPM